MNGLIGVIFVATCEVPGVRTDDYCPVCDAWPRTTRPAPNPPRTDRLYRMCYTCYQTWLDHGDHTPTKEPL